MKNFSSQREQQKLKKFAKLSKIFFLTILFLIIAAHFYYHRIDLYFSDRYLWYQNEADRHYRAVDFPEAVRLAEKAVELDKLRPNAYMVLFKTYYITGQYLRAEQELRNMVNVAPSMLPYYCWRLGQIRIKQGKSEEAKDSFIKGIEADKSLPYNYAYLGIVYLKENDTNKSMYYINKSFSMVDHEPSVQYVDTDKAMVLAAAHVAKGIAVKRLGNYQEGRKEVAIGCSLSLFTCRTIAEYLGIDLSQ